MVLVHMLTGLCYYDIGFNFSSTYHNYVPFCHLVRELDGSWKEVHSIGLPEGLRFHTCIIWVSFYLWTLLGYFQRIVTLYLQHIVTSYLQHIVTPYLQHIVTPYLQHSVTSYLQHIVTSWTRAPGMQMLEALYGISDEKVGTLGTSRLLSHYLMSQLY